VKFMPIDGSFLLDPSFNTTGRIGKPDKTAGSGDGEFNAPFDVAVTPDGEEISVSDSGNQRIQRFTKAGVFLSSFGQQGSDMGQLNAPKGLACDELGTLYIVDSGNNRAVVASSSGVIGVSGSSGTALGQFAGPVNLGVGSRGVYVADAGNNRVQAFDPLEDSDPTPLKPRLALAGQFTPALNQPSSVSVVADLLQEKLYIADTGNNRVLLIRLPLDNPESVWSAMKQRLLAGDIAAAIPYFCSLSGEKYRRAYLSIGTPALIPVISQIPETISPVFIESETAQYYFQQPVGSVTITFPIDFVKENGIWKITEY